MNKQKIYKERKDHNLSMPPGDLKRSPDESFFKETLVFIDETFLEKLSQFFGNGRYLKFDKINLDSDYVRDMLAFLLFDEANNFKRWKNEFKELFKGDRIVMIYGSAIVNYSRANDIDLMILRKKERHSKVNGVIAEKQKVLPKKIHLIELSQDEFLKNLEEKQNSIMNIVKTAIILYGQFKYMELIKNVKSI